MHCSYIWKALRGMHQFSATPMGGVPSLGRLIFWARDCTLEASVSTGIEGSPCPRRDAGTWDMC